MKIHCLFFVILSLSIGGCKTDNKATSPTAKAEKMKEMVGDDYAMLNQEDLKEDDIRAMRLSALNILDHRIKESGAKSITIIDKDIWRYDAVVKNSDMITGDSLGGKWVDFKEDMTYQYGSYEEPKGSGRYHYDLEKSLLLLVDDNEYMKPQEFEVKALNDMLVLVGAYIYKDNNLQTKLLREAAYPKAKK